MSVDRNTNMESVRTDVVVPTWGGPKDKRTMGLLVSGYAMGGDVVEIHYDGHTFKVNAKQLAFALAAVKPDLGITVIHRHE